MPNKIHIDFDQLKCCVVVPTYNNEKTLQDVLEDIQKWTSNIIVINDGSTDSTFEILSKFTNIATIHLPKNQGKGKALRTGFKKALQLGYTHAITIDSDGQHFPGDLPLFLEKLKEDKHQLIVGARNMEQSNIPGKSSFGNKFSNFWYWVETGIKMKDTQSGYRLYPIKSLEHIRLFTPKFEFEIEILVRAAWKGIKINSIPVEVYYASPEERISHFRPFKDFFRISVLNTILVFFAFLYFRPIMFFRNLTIQKLKEIFGSGESKSQLALSIGFGIFMGIVPIWGYQMIVAAALAVVFKLNKALVLIASNISIPPMIPLIIFCSFWAGQFFVEEPIKVSLQMNLNENSLTGLFQYLKTGLLQYIIGSVLLAITAGLLFSLITFVFISIKRRKGEVRQGES